MSDLVTRTSSDSVETAVERLLDAIRERSITVFARIDHAQGARDVGLELHDETVIVFGNPQTGTPLMQKDPRCGIDLPLRILVWEEHGTTTIAYHDPRELANSYRVLAGDDTLDRMRDLLEALVVQVAL